MPKLKLLYFGHLMWRTDSLEKTLMLGKIEGRRSKGQQRMIWMATPTQWAWVWAISGRWWWTGKPGVLQSKEGHKESDTTEGLNDNTTLTLFLSIILWKRNKLFKNHKVFFFETSKQYFLIFHINILYSTLKFHIFTERSYKASYASLKLSPRTANTFL